jgi:sulfonate transport system ATP-binding protein
VSRSFGARRVIEQLSLEVPAGDFLAVIGRSGCGKTTLLRLIAGLDVPSSGEVRLAGTPAALARPEVRMVFQEARLLPWRTVVDNVAIGVASLPAQRRARALAEALAQVGLAGRERDWPAVLSGGQRQRVALARALVSRPPLLLLDEPLGALDALTRLEMQGVIERLWREIGFTGVLVTHDVEEAVALADRVVVLEAGRVALDLPVPLRRPRVRHHPSFTVLVATILARLVGEATLATPLTVSAQVDNIVQDVQECLARRVPR